MHRCLAVVMVGLNSLMGCGSPREVDETMPEPDTFDLRVATFNIEDLRTEEVADPANRRARAAAAVIQELRPDVLLVNELTYDQPSGPAWQEGGDQGQNGQRFAENFLAVSQGKGLESIHYRAFMRPSNTGIASGYDFDNDGRAVVEPPELPPATDYPDSHKQTPEGRAYGGDNWGFGTFPGQYSMVLLVREDLEILEHQARTFQLFKWSAMPGALAPIDPETGEPWYSAEEWAEFRLSSKSHWDVPVRLPNGAVTHFLVSHPTPAAFDGEEQRNQKRNHDEIRFWADYLNDADYIYDDAGGVGGLNADASFVIMGDLNADPQKGNAFNNPIGRLILVHPRVQGSFTPKSRSAGVDPSWAELDEADTAQWGMRIDYVLPSVDLEIRDGAVERPTTEAANVSDHFPVWLDITVSPPSRR
jgi:endonuclease/exonuclease/phosphatase family metal-dependent hydrolase